MCNHIEKGGLGLRNSFHLPFGQNSRGKYARIAVFYSFPNKELVSMFELGEGQPHSQVVRKGKGNLLVLDKDLESGCPC